MKFSAFKQLKAQYPVSEMPEGATLWQVFAVFFRIGLFTIGGGYAMIPLIEREVVQKRRWLNLDDFVELLALAQASPGILAMNMAVFVGYRTRSMKGALVASLGAVLPSFLIILWIALFFSRFEDNKVVIKIFKGMRPAVVALIAVPIIRMVKSVGLTWKTAWIPVAATGLIVAVHVNPIWTVIAGAAGGLAWSLYRQSKNNK